MTKSARRLPTAALGLLGLACLADSGCDRAAKLEPPSVATALRAAKDDLDLPDAKHVDAEPDPALAHVVVSRSRISVLDDPWPIANVPADAALGLPSEDKRSGRSSVLLPALVQALEWQRSSERPSSVEGAQPSSANGIVIVADRRTTYRIACEVAASAGSVGSFAFAARTGDRARAVGIIKLTPPRAGREARRNPFSVRYSEAGATISMNGRSIAAGCKDVGPGSAVARAPYVAFDFGALQTCLEELRKQAPELEDETLLVGAEPGTDLATVVMMLDAARGAGFDSLALLAPTESPAR